MERDINLKIIYFFVGGLVWTEFLMFVGEFLSRNLGHNAGLFSPQGVKTPLFSNGTFGVCIVSYFVLLGLIMWFRRK